MWCGTSKRMGKFALQIGNKTEVGVLGRIVEARLRSKGLKVVRDHVPAERLQTTDLSGEAVLNALRLLSPWHAGHELIRLGEDRDGGYLVPDDLDGIRACFSPGVDLASHFERDCIQRGIRVHLADASVDGPGPELLSHEKDYTFRKAFVGPCSQGEALISLADWVNAEAPGEDELMLQMDIEGAEFQVLPALMRSLAFCTVGRVFIEWHAQLFDRTRVQAAASALRLPEGLAAGAGALEALVRGEHTVLMQALGNLSHSGCETRLSDLDDETYARDAVPLGGRRALCTDQPSRTQGLNNHGGGGHAPRSPAARKWARTQP